MFTTILRLIFYLVGIATLTNTVLYIKNSILSQHSITHDPQINSITNPPIAKFTNGHNKFILRSRLVKEVPVSGNAEKTSTYPDYAGKGDVVSRGSRDINLNSKKSQTLEKYPVAFHDSEVPRRTLENCGYGVDANLRMILCQPDPVSPSKFDYGSDTLVFVHIQKTGGSRFERFLTGVVGGNGVPCACQPKFGANTTDEDGKIVREKRRISQEICDCPRSARLPRLSNDKNEVGNVTSRPGRDMWLYTRATMAWAYCGVHATFQQLVKCVPYAMELEKIKRYGTRAKTKVNRSYTSYLYDRKVLIDSNILVEADGPASPLVGNDGRYFYITLLREPVLRYMSEYWNVKKGKTWKGAAYVCNNELYPPPKCYEGPDWSNVSLNDFVNCSTNYANNRMTRHLANITACECYSNTLDEREESVCRKDMLESAKINLKFGLRFFGLLEFMNETLDLLNKTFVFELRDGITLPKLPAKNRYKGVNRVMINKIRDLNSLDIELYEFGKRLFFERYNKLREDS